MKHFLNYFLNRLALLIVMISVRPNNKKSGILITRLDNLGDLILALPALQAMRGVFANEQITLIISHRNVELGERLSEQGISVDELILLNRRKFVRNLWYKLAILKKVRKARYRIAINPAFSSELIPDHIIVASDAQRRIGWRGDYANISPQFRKKTETYYTELFKADSWQNEPERNAEFVKRLGASITEQAPRLILNQEDETVAEAVLAQYNAREHQFAVMCPGADQTYRRWPIERFAAIAEYLFSKGIATIICGTNKETHLGSRVTTEAKNPCIDLTGKTSVLELAALLKKSRLFIGNCSGPAHVAAAVGTPTVVIMGGGHFKRFFPYGDLNKNLIVYDPNMKCKDDNWACAKNIGQNTVAPCIEAISVEMVKEKIDQLLS